MSLKKELEALHDFIREIQTENRVLGKKLDREHVIVTELKQQLEAKERELAAAREADAFKQGYIEALEKVYQPLIDHGGPSHPSLYCACTVGDDSVCPVHGFDDEQNR